MFLGHYGVALALKRAEPKVSLGTLFIAAQLVGPAWGAFLLLGWEHVRILPDDNPLLKLQFYDYPISHSLVGAVGWGLAAAVCYYSWPTRDTTRHWQASALVGRRSRRTGCSTSSCTSPTCRSRATIRPSSASGSGVTSE